MSDSGLYQHTNNCDACGVQAFVTYSNGETRLRFCAHHTQKHHTALVKTGWTVMIDARGQINVKPSVSANVE